MDFRKQNKIGPSQQSLLVPSF